MDGNFNNMAMMGVGNTGTGGGDGGQKRGSGKKAVHVKVREQHFYCPGVHKFIGLYIC